MRKTLLSALVTSGLAVFSHAVFAQETQSEQTRVAIPVIQSEMPVSIRVDRPDVVSGTVATTGFSGTLEKIPDLANVPSKAVRDAALQIGAYRFIDLDSASATLTSMGHIGRAYDGSELLAKSYDQLLARDVGQVFGLAFDDADAPNLYLTATSAFGLQIVGPDRNQDRIVDRLEKGADGARWMNGQWGGLKDAGPGAVYKLDGQTHQLRLFTTVGVEGRENSGAALGNIVYDSNHKQLLVSDLESGLVHRFDMSGQDLGQFDHGVTARPNALDNAGRTPVAFDPATNMNISSGDFAPFDNSTWNRADPARRVWGLAVNGGRLYYAVAEGPAVWSVGLHERTGAFLEDARWELTLNDAAPSFDISDIVFSPDGQMILSQRPDAALSFDYKNMTVENKAEVLRYSREAPEDDSDTPSVWYENPVLHAVGFTDGGRSGLGGLAIGPGYTERGQLDWHNCRGNLWSTGENLRLSEQLRNPLLKGGALDVDGVQVVPVLYPAADNRPPWHAFFHDYAPTSAPETAPDGQGRIGDVEVLGCFGDGKPAGKGARKQTFEQVKLPRNPSGDPRFWCTDGVLQAGVCLCALFPTECFPSDPPKPDCTTVEPELVCDAETGTYVLNTILTDVSGGALDTATLNDPSGTISSLPASTPFPGPFSVDLAGMGSGQTGQVNICAYNAAEKETGDPFSCCNTTVSFKIPGAPCEVGDDQ